MYNVSDVRRIPGIKVLLSEETILKRIEELGDEISEFYLPRTDTLVAIGVLKGALHFCAYLLPHIQLDVTYSFINLSSYTGTNSEARIHLKSWIDIDIKNKYVLVVEDIIDSGRTIEYILKYLGRYKAKDLKVVTLLDKPSRRVIDVPIDFKGFEIEDKFVVGFGFDYNQKYRNLPYIGYLER
ncbi:MAG: hypoxanthine phosphoribosyltransferase [Thermotogae bacterium]|nr:hypoxanthine phosphoribosyltransferase [Thermotogota bacterium]